MGTLWSQRSGGRRSILSSNERGANHARARRVGRSRPRGVRGRDDLRRRTAVPWRCREALAIPAGADPGPQDGEGDDLLSGAGGVHPHQFHPDSARPQRVREVRQTGGRLSVEFAVEQIRKILRTSGQHNIVLFGAGHLGQAIASSDIFGDHGFKVVAIFDVDPKLVGKRFGEVEVRDFTDLEGVVEEQDVVVGVIAVPAAAAQDVADRLVEAGVKIIFNYSEQLLQVPPEVTVHTSSPAVDLLYALYFYLT